jgi:hypothetical protein
MPDYDSTADFRELFDKDTSPSLNHGKQVRKDHNFFTNLIPKSYLNLIQEDSLKEGFGNPASCKSFCGFKSGFCKDVRDGRPVCRDKINLDSKIKCEQSNGGKTCKWVEDEYKICTPECRKWGCDNCKGHKNTAELDELEQLYNETLSKYVTEYKSLGDPNLTQQEGITLASSVNQLNQQLQKTADVLYQKILETKIAGAAAETDITDLNKIGDKGLNNLKKLQKRVDSALRNDKTELGEYADNKLRVNYAYYHYLIWIIIVLILISGIILLQNGIKLPPWPLKAVPILFFGGIGYFIFTRIWNNINNIIRQAGASI